MSDPGDIVQRGYDAMADRFAAWQREITGSVRLAKLDRVLELLPPDPDVLELGCGAGVHSTRVLAERGRLTGVDVSREQLRRARERVAGATFVHADLAHVDFPAGSFDAVVAFYVFNHVPQAVLRALVPRVFTWLRPAGVFLATYAASDPHESVDEFIGVPMFFASLGTDESRTLLRTSGFEILDDEVEEIVEPDYGRARFLWLLGRKPNDE